MPFAPALAAIGSVIGAGTAVYGATQQEKARQAADNEMGRQGAARKAAEEAAKAKLLEEEAKNASEAQKQSQIAQIRASARTGRKGTLLTQGLQSTASGQGGKTLLGQ